MRARSRRGAALQEVLFLEWDIGNRDFGPIAGRVKEANPDFIWNGVLGLEGNQLLDAMKKIDYQPREHFYMYPAPGPMLKAPEGNNALTVTIFEDQPPFTNSPVAAAFVKSFHERATKADLPDTNAETQAAASFAAWQIIEAGVVATQSLDDKKIADWIKANQVDTIEGKLRFNERGNFGADLSKVKQVQNGRWVTVWTARNSATGSSSPWPDGAAQLHPARAARDPSAASSPGRSTACWASGSACRGDCCGRSTWPSSDWPSRAPTWPTSCSSTASMRSSRC